MLKSIEITIDDAEIVRIKTNPKIIMAEASGKNTGYVVKAVGENHTVGNLVNYYLRRQVTENNYICSYTGYRVDHPLIEEVEWLYTLDNETEENIDKLIEDNYTNIRYFTKQTKDADTVFKVLQNQTYLIKREYVYTCIIVDAFRQALSECQKVRTKLSDALELDKTTYTLDDPSGNKYLYE
jgi:DNA-directed RNA polymerase subunit L